MTTEGGRQANGFRALAEEAASELEDWKRRNDCYIAEVEQHKARAEAAEASNKGLAVELAKLQTEYHDLVQDCKKQLATAETQRLRQATETEQ